MLNPKVKTHSIYINGVEMLRATKDENNKKVFYKGDNVAMMKTTKTDFMQTLERLHNINIVNDEDYVTIKTFYF